MNTNYKSNAKFLGNIIGAPMQISHLDQYQPMPAPLFVEDEQEQGTVVGNWEPSEFDIYGIQPLEIMDGESFEQMEARLKGVQL